MMFLNEWVAFCSAAAGEVLPVNHIMQDGEVFYVGHAKPDGDPIVLLDGQVARFVALRFSTERGGVWH